MGFKINDDGTICAVPEQIPNNWYRRSTPYGIANVVANAPGTLAAGNTLPSPLSSIIASGNTNEIGCQLYQLLSSQSPATLGVPLVDGVSTLLTGLQNQLLGGLPVRSAPGNVYVRITFAHIANSITMPPSRQSLAAPAPAVRPFPSRPLTTHCRPKDPAATNPSPVPRTRKPPAASTLSCVVSKTTGTPK